VFLTAAGGVGLTGAFFVSVGITSSLSEITIISSSSLEGRLFLLSLSSII